MSKPKAKKQSIEMPDVMAGELVRIVNTAHEDGKLISGFVCLLEMYDGKKKTIKIVSNQDMPEYQVFGLINYAQQKFEYSLAPDDDDWDDDTDYDPRWYEGQ
jgi:hypothetical protein